MIEVIPTSSGQDVLKLNGKYLSSPMNPRKASEKWLIEKEAQFFHQFENYDVAFIVGAGSGYEAYQLIQKHKHLEVVVVDTNIILLEHLFKIHPSLRQKVSIFCANTIEEVLNSQYLLDLMKKHYMVLSGRNSLREDQFLLNQIIKTLNCRTIEALKSFAKNDSSQSLKSQISEIEKKISKNEAVSLKHVIETQSIQSPKGEYIQELLLTLKELIR